MGCRRCSSSAGQRRPARHRWRSPWPKRLPGTEIISADSRQVYRGMDIGTAKVTADERRRVPHHGLDLVDPDQRFTAADFRRHALGALTGMSGRAPLAVLVGGTGLYLRAVARGLPLEETGSDPAAARDARDCGWPTTACPRSWTSYRPSRPAVAARTDLANPRRVVRALERARVPVIGRRPRRRLLRRRSRGLVWTSTATTHDGWIERRARGQFAAGLLDEANLLRATVRSFAARLQRVRLPRSIRRARRPLDAGAGDCRRRVANTPVRSPPTNVVPLRARTSIWLPTDDRRNAQPPSNWAGV